MTLYYKSIKVKTQKYPVCHEGKLIQYSNSVPFCLNQNYLPEILKLDTLFPTVLLSCPQKL